MFVKVLLLASSGKSSSLMLLMLREGAPSSSGTDNKQYHQHQNYTHWKSLGRFVTENCSGVPVT
jgi:hypothetical protein